MTDEKKTGVYISSDPVTVKGKIVVIKPGPSSALGWGLILIAAGVLLLLDQAGVLPIARYFHFWPAAFIVVGLFTVFQREGRAIGLAFLVVGGILMSNALGYTNFGFHTIWPIGLILIGGNLLWGAVFGKDLKAPSGDVANSFNDVCVFSGVGHRITTKSFKGGKAVAVFGGGKIDLRDADFETNEVAVELTAVFGGFELIVPRNWNVVVRGVSMFGAYTNSTLSAADSAPPAQKTLIVRGSAIFGGVEIKN